MFLIPQCMDRLIFWSFWTHPSVFDLVHLILHLNFILAILALWSYFFWLVMLSWTWSLSLNETWLQPTDSDNFISSLAPSGFSISNSPRLTGHGGGLAVIHNHSSKSNHSVLETFVLLYLLSLLWKLNLLLATKKLSFLISIVLHLLKSLYLIDGFQNLLELLFLYLLNLSSLVTLTFILILTWQHLTNFLAFLTTSTSNSTHIFLLMMMATVLIFLLYVQVLTPSLLFHTMNPINLTTNLSLLSSFHTLVLLLNALSFNIALSNHRHWQFCIRHSLFSSSHNSNF